MEKLFHTRNTQTVLFDLFSWFLRAFYKISKRIFGVNFFVYTRVRNFFHFLTGNQYGNILLQIITGECKSGDFYSLWHSTRINAIGHDYCRGDMCFHVGQYQMAMRYWIKSLRRQRLLELKLYSKARRSRSSIFRAEYWGGSIGHISLLACMIKLEQLGLLDGTRIEYVVNNRYIANDYLFDKLESYMSIIENSTFNDDYYEICEQKLNVISTKIGDLFLYHACALAEKLWQEEVKEPLLKATPDELDYLYKQLGCIGLNRDRWYAALHVRGGNYKGDNPEITRNARLDGYILAVDEVIKRGGQVLLFGEPNIAIPPELSGKVIDYANSDIRSRKLDVLICAASRFFWGTSSGIAHVPGLFGVPVLYVNLAPVFSRPWRKGDIWIPKIIFNNKNGSMLSLDEMMNFPAGLLDTKYSLHQHGFSVRDNTPKEILAAVQDMLDQIEGRGCVDVNLQQYVRDLDRTECGAAYQSEISQRFLFHVNGLYVAPTQQV